MSTVQSSSASNSTQPHGGDLTVDLTDAPDPPSAAVVGRAAVQLVGELKLARPAPMMATTRAVGSTVVYVGLVWLGFRLDSIVGWIPIWVTCSLVLLGCGPAIHEAAHQNLYRRRWANHLAGLLWGMPILASFVMYRAAHLAHHKWTHEARDSEPLDRFTSVAMYVVGAPLVTVAYLAMMWKDAVMALAGRPSDYARRFASRPMVALNLAIFVAAAIGLGIGLAVAPAAVMAAWGVPWVITVVFWLNLVALPEHYEMAYGPAPVLETTRTVTTTPLLRVAYWNHNWHAEHHLAPQVPSSRLSPVNEAISGEHPWVQRGYLRYHAALVGRIRRGEIPDEPPNAPEHPGRNAGTLPGRT